MTAIPAQGFPWQTHRTMAEADETNKLLGYYYNAKLSQREMRRLTQLLRREHENNPQPPSGDTAA